MESGKGAKEKAEGLGRDRKQQPGRPRAGRKGSKVSKLSPEAHDHSVGLNMVCVGCRDIVGASV